MSHDLRKYTELKEKAEQLRRRAERARGAVDQLLNQLKTDYGIDSLEEAEKVLKERIAKEDGMQKEIDLLVERFINVWESKLLER